MARATPLVLLLALLGVLCLGVGVWRASERSQFLSTAEQTVGTVTRWESHTYTRERKRYGRVERETVTDIYPVAAFTYQGTEYEVKRGDPTQRLPVGTQVPILFQPGAPQQSHFNDEDLLWQGVMEAIYVGLGMLVFSGGMHLLIRATSSERRRGSGVALHRPREQTPSAPPLNLRAHVPGKVLSLAAASRRRAELLGSTAGFGIILAVLAFRLRAPLPGLGILLVAGAALALIHRWTARQVTFTLAGVELRRGFHHQRFERTGLRGVRLEPDTSGQEGNLRLWLDPRASNPAHPSAPIEALHASLSGPSAVVRAERQKLQEALEALDLRVSEPEPEPRAEVRPAPEPGPRPAPSQGKAVVIRFHPGEKPR